MYGNNKYVHALYTIVFIFTRTLSFIEMRNMYGTSKSNYFRFDQVYAPYFPNTLTLTKFVLPPFYLNLTKHKTHGNL
jgi:hypothetical protein